MENIKLHLTQLTFVVLVWLFGLYCYTKVDSLNREVIAIHGREKAQEISKGRLMKHNSQIKLHNIWMWSNPKPWEEQIKHMDMAPILGNLE